MVLLLNNSHCCIGFGRKEVVEFLLENGAKVDAQDDGECWERVAIVAYHDAITADQKKQIFWGYEFVEER